MVGDETGRTTTDGLSRRELVRDGLRVLAAVALAELAGGRALAAGAGAEVTRWWHEVQRVSATIKAGRATTRAWRRRLPRVTRRVSASALRRAIDFDALASALAPLDDPEPQRRLALPVVSATEGPAFVALLTHVRKGFAVVPHGHHNMVSMHVVLEGTVRVRQYDRVADEPDHLVLRPRLDRVLAPGEATAISADRGNVHWFQGLTDAYALVVAAYGLARGAAPSGRDYVDPLAAEAMSDGTLRVPRLDVDEAYARYLRF
jgi:hypothetical protein